MVPMASLDAAADEIQQSVTVLPILMSRDSRFIWTLTQPQPTETCFPISSSYQASQQNGRSDAIQVALMLRASALNLHLCRPVRYTGNSRSILTRVINSS